MVRKGKMLLRNSHKQRSQESQVTKESRKRHNDGTNIMKRVHVLTAQNRQTYVKLQMNDRLGTVSSKTTGGICKDNIRNQFLVLVFFSVKLLLLLMVR